MINLPTYSKGEEIFNCISHAVGTILSIVVIIYCFISKISGIKLASCLIYAVSLLILYSASALYHGLSKKYEKTKKVLRIIDHCVIYLLIGGSYTPFILIIIRDYNIALGNFFIIYIWAIALLGICLNVIDLKKFSKLSMVLYLFMGWSIMFQISLIYNVLGLMGFLLLLFGGLSYTIGVIFYGVGRKIKWMHSIFHLFVLLGSILHVICVLGYVF